MSAEAAGRDPFEEIAESFLERFRRGERPPLSDYVERYPHLADEIREFFPALVMMEQAAPSCETAAALRPGTAPTRLGDYRLLREVGHGGMGIVYEAVQESLGRHVVLKVLPPPHAASPTRLERFHREARAAAALHHSNIVPVFGVGEDQGVHYFAMQFIQGHSLATVLGELKAIRSRAGETVVPAAAPADSSEAPVAQSRETAVLLDGSTAAGPLGPAYFDSVARIGTQVARALEYAHRVGVLHRDVKPANLLLDAKGMVWLTDFGLAKLESSDDLTGTGDVVGTLRYLAPERFEGKADARGDVYALALSLYELATLRPAFEAPDRPELIERIRHGVARPRQIEPSVPRDLETIILKGCDREPRLRYGSAGEMADDLEAFLADRPIKARPMRWWQHAIRWARRKPGVAILFALLVVTLVTGLSGVLLMWDRAERGWFGEARALAQEREALQEKGAALLQRELALEDAKTRLYARNVALADLSWGKNRVEQAKLLLDECPDERRGWEWHYLRRRCGAHLVALDRPGCQYVRFSPDGKQIALIVKEYTTRPRCYVELREAGSGKLDRIIALPGLYPLCVWEGGEKLLVATSTGTKTIVNDAWTGQWVQTFPTTGSALFSPDGKRMGQQGDKGTFRVWDVSTGTQLSTFDLPSAGSNVLTFTPDGNRLLVRPLTAKFERVQLLDAQTGHLVRVLNADEGKGAFAPTGGGLVLFGGRLRVCNPQTGRSIHPLLGTQNPVRQVAFSRDGSRLASGGLDGLVILWQWTLGVERFRLRGHAGAVEDVAFDATGRRLASCDTTGRVFVWDVTTAQEATVREWSEGSTNAVSADGRLLANGSNRIPLRVRDARTQKVVGPAIPLSGISFVHLSPSGDQVAGIARTGATVPIWDVKTGRQACILSREGRQVVGLAFGRAGHFAAAYREPGGVVLWDTNAGRLLRTLPSREGMSRTVCFSLNQDKVAALGRGGRRLYVWNANTGEGRRVALSGTATCLAFHPSGSQLAVGFQDGAVALCDAATLAVSERLGRHESAVDALAFHGDGRRLASAGEGVVKIWDVDRGLDLLELSLLERTGHVRELLFVDDELVANVTGLTRQLVRWDGAVKKRRRLNSP